MKYNKEKAKKFTKGGKTPKEIMEEARRNQALERQQQQEEAISSAIARDAANTAARDAVYNSGIPAYQSQPVTINMPNSYMLDRINPDRRTYTMGNSNLPEVVITGKDLRPNKNISFSQAFGEARKAGEREFIWNGDRFNTDLEDDTIYDGGTLPEVIITGSNPNKKNTNPPRSSTINENDSTRVVNQQPPLEKRVKDEVKNANRDWSQEQAPNRDLGTISANHSSKRIDWGWLRRTMMGLNQGSILYQQGGQLPSYQQGNKLHLRNGLEKFFRIEPRYTSVDSTSLTPTESVTDYMNNTWRGPERVSKIRTPRGGDRSGYLTSTRVIRNPWTDKADTTYIAPTGARFGPSRIIEAPYLKSYPDKFGKYFKHQQGGTIEESGPTDEMYVDFAVRYLSALGVGETEMVDEEGGLREEYAEAVTVALQEVDSPEFWEHYHSNPDEAVGAYVESKQSPEQVEMARKGAKLKKLQKLKKGTAKKCKCGCDLTMKKEKGGTITEVCSCGCKAK